MNDDMITRLPLIGDKAPAFQALTTNGTVHFPEDYEGKWIKFSVTPVSDNEPNDLEKEYFRKIVEIFNDISSAEIENTKMDHLSFGMSGDYEAAVSCGANIVRVGTGIFGARDYSKKN